MKTQHQVKNRTLLVVGIAIAAGVILFVTSLTMAYERYKELTNKTGTVANNQL
jgi:hypothetical protein